MKTLDELAVQEESALRSKAARRLILDECLRFGFSTRDAQANLDDTNARLDEIHQERRKLIAASEREARSRHAALRTAIIDGSATRMQSCLGSKKLPKKPGEK